MAQVALKDNQGSQWHKINKLNGLRRFLECFMVIGILEIACPNNVNLAFPTYNIKAN